MRSEALPIPDNDAQWLARIAETHKAELEDKSQLDDFARFLDTKRVLSYRNGDVWYDVNPLIRSEVINQAQRVKASSASNPQSSNV